MTGVGALSGCFAMILDGSAAIRRVSMREDARKAAAKAARRAKGAGQKTAND